MDPEEVMHGFYRSYGPSIIDWDKPRKPWAPEWPKKQQTGSHPLRGLNDHEQVRRRSRNRMASDSRARNRRGR